MYEFISQYSNRDRFNKTVIKDLRDQDNVYVYLENICKTLENISYIKYLGMEIIEDENKIPKRHLIGIKDTRKNLVIFRFRVEFKDEVEEHEIKLFVPKRINNNYFILNSNKYFAPYQIIDSSTYNTKNSVILKSILMRIIIRNDRKKFKDTEGTEYRENIFNLNLFSKKINILRYYLPCKGFQGTLEFLEMSDYISLVDEANDTDNYVYFNLKTKYLQVDRVHFNENKTFKSLVFTLIDCLVERGKRLDMSRLEDINYWKVKLGSVYTKNTNNQLEKSESVLLSFKRTLDDTTKNNLKIPEADKSDIFNLLRWIVFNYDKLKRKDNLNLLNKRFRYYEYIVAPFLRRVSNNTYRILNTKNLSMTKLRTLFKISPMIIIKSMQTSDLIRYNNHVNDMDMFNTSLKMSLRGPQALSSSNTVSVYYRDLNPSQIGRFALNHSSNTDPGMTGTLVPFIKTDGFYFNEKDELSTIDEF